MWGVQELLDPRRGGAAVLPPGLLVTLEWEEGAGEPDTTPRLIEGASPLVGDVHEAEPGPALASNLSQHSSEIKPSEKERHKHELRRPARVGDLRVLQRARAGGAMTGGQDLNVLGWRRGAAAGLPRDRVSELERKAVQPIKEGDPPGRHLAALLPWRGSAGWRRRRLRLEWFAA